LAFLSAFSERSSVDIDAEVLCAPRQAPSFLDDRLVDGRAAALSGDDVLQDGDVISTKEQRRCAVAKMRHLLQINLSVSPHACLANEVDDPFLALALREFERRGKVAVEYGGTDRQRTAWTFSTTSIREECSRNINLLVNTNVGLADYKPGILKELVLEFTQEEITVQNTLRFA